MSIATQPRSGHAPHDLADLVVEPAILLGAGSTIFYQLAENGVGLGVAEHSTALERPLDRLRATMAYVYVAVLGTEEERRAVVRLVNEAHAPVRSPGRYSAFDRDLQLWVAATLVHNTIFVREKVWGPLDRAGRDRLYRTAQVFGNALQVRPEQWPATIEDFDSSWSQRVAALESDPVVRRYCHALLRTGGRTPVLGPLLSLLDRGNLDSRTREVLGFVWTARDQRRYDLFWRVFPPVYRLLPRRLRHLPAHLVLRDTRRRLRAGARVL